MLASVLILSARVLELRQWPHFDFKDLEWIENGHRDRIRALIGQVAANSGAQHFVGLADINRFAVVIKKCIHAPFEMPYFCALSRKINEWRIEKFRQICAQILRFKRRNVHIVRVPIWNEFDLARHDGLPSKGRWFVHGEGHSRGFLRSRTAFQKRFKQVVRQMPNDIDRDAVAGQMISLSVVFRQNVIVVESHKARGLPRSRSNASEFGFHRQQ